MSKQKPAGSYFVKQLFKIQIKKDVKVSLWNQVKSRMETCYSELVFGLGSNFLFKFILARCGSVEVPSISGKSQPKHLNLQFKNELLNDQIFSKLGVWTIFSTESSK